MDPRLVREAVDWFVRMHEGPPSAVTRTQFTEWLLRSPEHIRAFLEVTRSIESLSNLPREWDREKLIASAASERVTSNVLPLEGLARASTEAKTQDLRFRLKPMWIACIAGGALAVGALAGWLACEQWHRLL